MQTRFLRIDPSTAVNIEHIMKIEVLPELRSSGHSAEPAQIVVITLATGEDYHMPKGESLTSISSRLALAYDRGELFA